MNGVVAFTGAATLPVGCAHPGARLAVRVPSPRRRAPAGRRARHRLGARHPPRRQRDHPVRTLVPPVPEAGGPVALTVLAIGGVACLVLVLRALRTYRLTQRIADLWSSSGSPGWRPRSTTVAPHGILDLGWWIGHGIEIGGIALVGIPVARDLRLGAAHQLAPACRRPPRRRISSRRPRRSSARTSARCSSRWPRRTPRPRSTRAALRCSRRGSVTSSASRPVVSATSRWAGCSTTSASSRSADAVLKKPTALTDERVRRDPASSSGGRPSAARARWVPRRRALARARPSRAARRLRLPARAALPSELTLDARILAACDVYDALVSPRVYRDAWSPERAMQLLREGVGKQFDGKVVAALATVVGASARERLDRCRACGRDRAGTAAHARDDVTAPRLRRARVPRSCRGGTPGTARGRSAHLRHARSSRPG